MRTPLSASLVTTLALTALLGGCAHMDVIQTTSSQLKGLEQQPLTVINYDKKQDFVAVTPTKAMFGAIGAVAMVHSGNQIIEENAVPDPALDIVRQLAPLYVERLKTAQARIAKAWKGSDDIPELVQSVKSKGAILDVKTMGWNIGYFPTNWTHYRITYVARARLIDATSGTLIGQAPCTYVSDDESTAPTYDELMADQAALLKSKLATAATSCSSVISEALLKS